jgi:hypothetical protein
MPEPECDGKCARDECICPVDDAYDWVDDDSMSAEETMRRFEALGPEETVGPPP